ncbi:hypothetical protein BGZ61DRAFT_523330 [Ilyonectria robusta]|uniref:uncharacterized protein n=1 Tax=Ilyonectria robusta TaxID=1079257 RepID=UPI001E8E8B26|nr:uncharacterized protein BGZ61DRAFT_523330 [Ilyonectria robusta]KAH8661194.1 hypothetical protein BGZ61DRAFT_523330 [Ilyonectria robusta]
MAPPLADMSHQRHKHSRFPKQRTAYRSYCLGTRATPVNHRSAVFKRVQPSPLIDVKFGAGLCDYCIHGTRKWLEETDKLRGPASADLVDAGSRRGWAFRPNCLAAVRRSHSLGSHASTSPLYRTDRGLQRESKSPSCFSAGHNIPALGLRPSHPAANSGSPMRSNHGSRSLEALTGGGN